MTTESELTFSPKWNERYMALAQHVATWSDDIHTHTGCVIVGPDYEVRSTGYNCFPRGVKISPERLERPEKYSFIEHAERNAIYNATRYGASLRGCVLYVTLPPCADCARAIIQSGITEAIALAAPAQRSKDQPTWDASLARVRQMLDESGVRYYEMPNPINQRYNPFDCAILFNCDVLDKLSQNLINKLGFAHEATICMEEITELMTEWILDNSPENLASETADVIITMNHVITGYDIKNPVCDMATNMIRRDGIMNTKSNRMTALLEWQKEMIKNINRKKENLPEIISTTAAARAAITTDIIIHNNVAAVQNQIHQKINRTIERVLMGKIK